MSAPPAPRGRVVGIVLLLLACALTAGCSSRVAYDNSGARARAAQQRLLDQRAKAIRDHDLPAFMRTVTRGDPALRARQRRYFRGIVQFPLGRIRFTAMPTDWPHALVPADLRDATAVRVRQVVEITGFDARPEVSITGLVVAERDGMLEVVGDRTGSGSPFPGHTPQPWEVAAIHVVDEDGVLGVFDDKTVQYADRLLPVVASSATQDQSAFPFWWSKRVIVYCFGTPALLDSFRSVPGGNIRDLGAMSFSVYADTSGTRLSDMRFVVLPESVAVGGSYLARLVRHELTHVAIGDRDQGAPTWFIEGLAEYVGARPLPREERRIPSVALREAAGRVDALPSSAHFNGPDQDWHYALSWMACDFIAARFGEARLWDLMDAFHAARGSGADRRQDSVLEQEIGMDAAQLAAQAAARIRSLYG